MSDFIDNRWIGRELGGLMSKRRHASYSGYCFSFPLQINWHSHCVPEGPDWRPEQIAALQTDLPAK